MIHLADGAGCQPATGRRLSLPSHPSELARADQSIMVLHCIYIFDWHRNKNSAGVGPNQLFQPSDAYFAVLFDNPDSHPLLRTPAGQEALPLITSRVHTIFRRCPHSSGLLLTLTITTATVASPTSGTHISLPTQRARAY